MIILPIWPVNMRKPPRVFVDVNIILDLLCGRGDFYAPAAELFTLSETGKIELYTSALAFAITFYVLRKSLGNLAARNSLRKLKLLLRTLPVNERIIDLGLNSDFSDYEDALQYFTAREHGISVFLTRNTKDYKVKDIIIQTAEEYLKSKNLYS